MTRAVAAVKILVWLAETTAPTIKRMATCEIKGIILMMASIFLPKIEWITTPKMIGTTTIRKVLRKRFCAGTLTY
mgnify:CR=1 FL=1